MAPDLHDIASLQKQLENVEGNDGEAHKLYNNLGVAYMRVRLFNEALSAHRAEKQACRRLSKAAPKNASRLVDLAIAYRRCGDATLRVRALRVRGGQSLRERDEIATLANAQHRKGLSIALQAERAGGGACARVEVQAASAAVAESLLSIALATRNKNQLRSACVHAAKAARIAGELLHGDVTKRKRQSMAYSASVNFAIGLSALGDHKRAKTLFESCAVHALAVGDVDNGYRAVANLVDETVHEHDFECAGKYAAMWVKYAQDTHDEAEEADALRRVGHAAYEQFEYERARNAYKQAIRLAGDSDGRRDAEKNLEIVENALEEQQKDEEILDEYGKLIAKASKDADARWWMEAGNAACRIRRFREAIKLLEKYFEKVDTHDAAWQAVGISKEQNCLTIANLAQSYWEIKQYDDAVQWGTRELVAYGEDRAGQAQAWCNLGNYLSDSGKLEEGIDALKRSIEIAEECGEKQIAANARLNLDIEMEKLDKQRNKPTTRKSHARHSPAYCNDDTILDMPESAQDALPRFTARHASPALERDGRRNVTAPSVREGNVRRRTEATISWHSLVDDRCDSVVVFSGEPAEPLSRSIGTSSGAFSISRTQERRSHVTSVGDRSCGRYIDVAAAYKKHYNRRTRDGVLSVLRDASAQLLLTHEQLHLHLDFSRRFITDAELSSIVAALRVLRDRAVISLSIARNPLLTSAGYDVFSNDGARCIRSLDLSGSGADLACIRAIARALANGGALHERVVQLNLSKNAIGRGSAAAVADVCVALLVSGSALRSLDLSLNSLSNDFLRLFVRGLRQQNAKTQLSSIDLRMNNRRTPNALLEFEDAGDVLQCFTSLTDAMPELHEIDVRSCGAAPDVRRALYSLNRAQHVVRVNIVSEGVFDEAVL